MIEHDVDVPDGAPAALKGFAPELAAIAFVAQTADGRRAVIEPIDANELLIARLELGAVAGVAAKLEAERNRHIRRSGGGLRVGNDVHFLIGGGINFSLTIRQRLIDGFATMCRASICSECTRRVRKLGIARRRPPLLMAAFLQFS